MKILSLGWGVQSWTLAAMIALGELPPVDVAIHSDTTHERAETYAFAARWTPWLENHGVKVVIVRAPVAVTDYKTGITPPWFTTGPRGDGMLRRTCTDRWKIRPMRHWYSDRLKAAGIAKSPGIVEQQLGITLDEWTRMRTSPVKWITLTYPFMDMDPPWSRHMALRWLKAHDLEIPVKSACTFCPYHDRATWQEMKRTAGDNWTDALVADAAIRHRRPELECFVHRDRVPLETVDLRSEKDHGQLELWPEECTGTCFL